MDNNNYYANTPPNTYNNVPMQNNIPTQNSMPMQNNTKIPTKKPDKNIALVGAVCGVIGLAVGAASIFAIMQTTKKPDPECQECTCPKCTAGDSSAIETGIFALEPKGQNIIYSPLSIRYGLNLLKTGAAGTTKSQIEKALGDGELPKYRNLEDILSLANAVFVRDTFKDSVLSTYTETVQNDYDAEVLYDDFSSSSNMDNWVNQKTFGLIDKIGVQPTGDTKMVLTNALAIKMDWEEKFDTDNTRGRTFRKQNGDEVEATTMNKTTHSESIKYYKDDNITLLSMPLKKTHTDVRLDFVAVLPNSLLDDYVDNLDLDAINTAIDNSIMANTSAGGVEIHIPKFKYDYSLNLKSDLQNLGVNQAFTDSADFSAMASKPLSVSDASHRANIDFSEDGIKAAAITVFDVKDAAMADIEKDQPVIINIDRPFMFLIRDRDNGAIWFTGAVYEPNLWGNDSAIYRPSES